MRLIDAEAFDKTLEIAEMDAQRQKKYVLRSAINTIRGNLRNAPTVQPEPHWIPCSERLPKESRKYLVTVFDGIGKRTTFAPYHRRSNSWTLTGRMAYWKVIAWMPLPEPYKG